MLENLNSSVTVGIILGLVIVVGLCPTYSNGQQDVAVDNKFMSLDHKTNIPDFFSQALMPRQLSLTSTQSFIQRRLFNTSVALTVPLFSFTLPQRATQGSTVDLANQAIFGLFALLVSVLVFTVPVLFTGVRPSPLTGRDAGGTEGILNNLMSSTPIFNLMGADLQHKIGLDPSKCVQKMICQAHRAPHNKHYGILAVPFQIFFPPPPEGKSLVSSSIFQIAAREGKYSQELCSEKFPCFFDVLDLAVYLIDWYKYSSEN